VPKPILLTETSTPPPALFSAGLENRPAIVRGRGERASRFTRILYRQNP
jgi:hypothetical protein